MGFLLTSLKIFDVSETTCSLCLEHFCPSVQRCFGYVRLRSPSEADIVLIQQHFSRSGFPGCICCMEKLSEIFAGNHDRMKGKSGTFEVRVEVI